MSARLLPDQPPLPDPGPECPSIACPYGPERCGLKCPCIVCYCPACTERERRARHLRPVLERTVPLPSQLQLDVPHERKEAA